MASLRTLATVTLLLSTMSACGSSPDDEPIACVNQQPGNLELGTGDSATGFIPLEDGGEIGLGLVAGGPRLLTVSLRATDFEHPTDGTGDAEVTIEISRDLGDGSEDVAHAFEEMVTGPPDGVVEILGINCVVGNVDIDSLVNDQIQIDAEVIDGCGRPLKASKTATVVW